MVPPKTLFASVFLAMASHAVAKPVVVSGQVGMLGEWALKADLDASKPDATAYAGPMVLKHIGQCSVSGPEEKAGAATAIVHDGLADHLTLTFGDESCVYPGVLRLSKTVTRGYIRCRRGNEVPISLWSSP